jgi:hypothetical protein
MADRHDLSTPELVMARLVEIENDLANKQNAWELAAMAWFRAKRDKERAHAIAFLAAEGSVAERTAIATRETAVDGKEDEALYEALKGVIRMLETRATIGQSLLRAQGRS